MKEIPFGYCQCGCGQKTKIANSTQTKYGWTKGMPRSFLRGHNNKINHSGRNNPSWKGGRRINGYGYVMVCRPDHPRAHSNGYVLEHIIIAEKALGKPLPNKAIVHHHDENKKNNHNNNLVICEDDAYHFLLHKRMRALAKCGNTSWEKCVFCKNYDDPKNLFIESHGTAYHKSCSAKYARQRRKINQKFSKDPHYRRGDKNGNSKLKAGEVWLIKKILSHNLIKQIFISKMFGTSAITINHINRKRTWAHIKYPETITQ